MYKSKSKNKLAHTLKMFTVILVIFTLLTITGTSPAASQAQGIIVAETLPANGETSVDPATTEIIIAFSAPVKMNSYSFVAAGQGELPEITGKPYFPNNQTCVLPVALQPDTTYSIGVNDETHTGFKSAMDETVSVTPYALTFTTGSGGQAGGASAPLGGDEDGSGWGLFSKPTAEPGQDQLAPQVTTEAGGWGFMAEDTGEVEAIPEATAEIDEAWGFFGAQPEESVEVPTVAPQATQPPKESGAGADTLLLRRYLDRTESAFTILVPDGWVTDGGIARVDPLAAGGPMNAIAAKVNFMVASDDNLTVGIYFMPDMMFYDTKYSPAAEYGAFPPGSNYQGMTVWPLMPADQFLAQVVFPELHSDATNIQVIEQRPLPQLTQKYTARLQAFVIPTTFSYDAAALTVVYDEGGVRYKEKLFAVVEDWGALGAGMWGNKETIVLRAPESEFDRWEPVLSLIQSSVRINPQWLAGEIKGQIDRGEIVLKTQAEIQRLEQEMLQHQQTTNWEINNDMFLTLTEKEEYVNPYTNEVETGVNQYQNRWQNSQGDVLYTNDEYYDPNTDINLHLTQDFKRSPVRPRGPSQ